MLLNEKITRLLFDVIDEFNAQLTDDEKLEKNINTVLFGDEGKLSSLDLVNFIVAIEQKIEDVFNKTVSIANEKAVSRKKSPFRTVETIIDYVSLLLEEKK